MLSQRLVVTPESGREGLAARLGRNVIFETQYSKGRSHSTTWKPDPSKPIEYFIGELGNFLEHLVNTKYRPTPGKVFPPGIMHVWSPDGEGERCLPLEDLLGAKPKFLSSQHLNSTYFLRINTFHADFGMQSEESEANRGKRWPFEPWNPESGHLYLINNNPELCAAVSGLISRTSRFNVSTEQIIPALRDAYTR